ncbi:hypothetical protein, partial [Faecalibacterium tardum]
DRFPFLSPAVTSSPGRGKSALSGEQTPARSAALLQKAALQMPFPVTTSPVKMRLERSAERDKREIKIILPLNIARAKRRQF